MGSKHKAVDWIAIKQQFIAGAMSLTDLAREHDINQNTMRQRANREGWQDARTEWRRNVTETATEQAKQKRIDELAKMNEADIRLANAARAQIALHFRLAGKGEEMQRIPPKDLRALLAAHDAAQKISRLAMGVSTDNHQHTGEGGGPIAHTDVPLDEYLAAREMILKMY